MARSVVETARILQEIYDEDFNGEESEPYRIGWDQLRGIAGVERLTDEIIGSIGKNMLDSGYVLVPFDDFLMVGMESNFRRTRKLPARLVEAYLAVSNEEIEPDDGDQEIGSGDETV
ncbi:hypothetical protein KI809_09390 [Geobacter pelophilus]|uniref:Uncharacterized protein n=1 Tax=Geoanaerobacter pelophilus TaxID=60036 RepID=A0AAW4L4N0_9BACT|nr:hypothetical protein [Geoanaerobacter pelophilus]MBT0664512.1 hypothetical protein [Geoanaerobacter pelophilus]